jgi:hypothetical protein
MALQKDSRRASLAGMTNKHGIYTETIYSFYHIKKYIYASFLSLYNNPIAMIESLKEIYGVIKYRELLRNLIARDIKVRYKSSFHG